MRSRCHYKTSLIEVYSLVVHLRQ